MVKITGSQTHSNRLKAMTSGQAVSAMGRALYVGSDKIRVEARRLIADGAIQGKGHIPSKPGEPPNWDTGQLANEITNTKTGPLSAETRSSAPYASDLEYGTSKMAERPYMHPATENMRDDIAKDVGGAYFNIIRKVR